MQYGTRLEAFEAMLSSIQQRYEQITVKLGQLKAEDKVTTVTYRQLISNKLML